MLKDQIEDNLTFDDVLIRPKRSTLSSRRLVDLEREFNFRHSDETWKGIPIIAANMDGVGELGIAEKLSEFGMITCLTKQHDVKKIKQNKIGVSIQLSIGNNK